MTQQTKRPCSTSTIPIWVKDPYAANSCRVLCGEDYQLIDVLEHMIEGGEGHFEHYSNAKASFFTVTHKGRVLLHDSMVTDICGITCKEPLMIDVEDECKFHFI